MVNSKKTQRKKTKYIKGCFKMSRLAGYKLRQTNHVQHNDLSIYVV